MNKADKKPDYKKIYRIVKHRFDETSHFSHGPFDETYYSMRVYESSKEIIKGLNKKVNVQEVLVASILHDIGKTKLKTSKIFGGKMLRENLHEEWNKHAKLGVPMARRILKKLGHSDEFIERVCYLIENHPLRGKLLNKRTLELKIIQDADLIADIGFAGFTRPFLYSGKFKRSIEGAIRYVQKEDRTHGFKEINLKVSLMLAKKEMKLQKKLAKEILKDIDSDLF
jgi:HD superfamily phosphodiesterase